MSLRGWRVLRLKSRPGNYPVDDQFVNSHVQKLQKASAAATNRSFLVLLRSVSSSVIDRSSDGTMDSQGDSGGPGEPPQESLGQDKDVPKGAEDKRMWRKWIEERLAHSSSSAEENDTPSSGNSQVKETAKESLVPQDAGVSKRSSSLESIFRAALKPSSNAAVNAEDSRTSNLRNPFRRENVKSSFFPDRESYKHTSIGAKRGSFFQESAKRPSFVPVRQVPGNAPQPPLDNLSVEPLDEFENRVLGSANDEDDPIDDDFLRDLDEIGRSARGIQLEDDSNLEVDDDEDWGDENAQVLTDLALSNSEEFDLEDEENPYRMRSDRLFFPGQTYDPEDLDLSKEADPEKPTVRTRKKYPAKEVYRIADFRNPRYLSNFIRESSRILPKRHFRISAKAQRKVAREIKTARILGLMPFTSMGDPPFRFLRSRSDEDSNVRFDDY